MSVEVWGPRVERMRLRRPGSGDVEMTAAADGWWTCDGDLADGERYGFVLGDGDHVRPDPRSRRQPDGVHGLSAHVDHEALTAAAPHLTDAMWTGR